MDGLQDALAVTLGGLDEIYHGTNFRITQKLVEPEWKIALSKHPKAKRGSTKHMIA